MRLPHRVAQDDSAIPGLIFVRGKGPAEQRFDSEQVEQFAGNSFADDMHCLFAVSQRETPIDVDRGALKDAILRTPILEVRI